MKRSAGFVIGPISVLRVILAPWRRAVTSSDIAAVDSGEGRTMLCWFRGLYGDYPRRFSLRFLDLTREGLYLRTNRLFIYRTRIAIGEQIVSARIRPPESLKEALRIGSGGIYAAGGPLELAGAAIITCTTPRGVLEFAAKRADVPLLLHYLERMSRQNALPSDPAQHRFQGP